MCIHTHRWKTQDKIHEMWISYVMSSVASSIPFHFTLFYSIHFIWFHFIKINAAGAPMPLFHDPLIGCPHSLTQRESSRFLALFSRFCQPASPRLPTPATRPHHPFSFFFRTPCRNAWLYFPKPAHSQRFPMLKALFCLSQCVPFSSSSCWSCGPSSTPASFWSDPDQAAHTPGT